LIEITEDEANQFVEPILDTKADATIASAADLDHAATVPGEPIRFER